MVMKKRRLLFVMAVVVSFSLLLCTSCGDGDGVITVTVFFIDHLTGYPIEGIVVTVNGQQETSDASGSVSVSSEDASMILEAYLDLEQFSGLEYQAGNGAVFERFTVTSSFTGTYFIDPLSDSLAFQISGTIETKTGGTLTAGDVDIYTSDGRLVGNGDADGAGNYNATVANYPNNIGNLYFVVSEDGIDDPYYTIKNVTGAGTYDLQYDGSDITISGDTGDAEQVQARLELGGTTWVYIGGLSIGGPYSITVPHQGSDVVRMYSQKRDANSNTYRHYSQTKFTSSATENLMFAGGSTVDPQTWESNISWSEESRTLTFNAAGNSTMYYIAFWDGEYPLLKCMVEDNTLIVPQDIDLNGLDEIDIKPYWSDGVMHTDFMPWGAVWGTEIDYSNLYVAHFLGV